MKIAANAQFSALRSMIVAAVAALVCTAGAGMAQASESGVPLTKKVVYGDLNLDSEQGANALYRRLRRAAEDVCAPFNNVDLARRVAWQICVNHAVAVAVEQVNRPMVTAVHNRSVNRSSSG
jgi:UrcA family protein